MDVDRRTTQALGTNKGSPRANKGLRLAREWGLAVEQGRYSQGGTWYEPPYAFPVAFCDPRGYVLFRTYAEYERCSELKVGEKVNIRAGLATVPGYVRMR